jgi:hypothetical protein
VVREESTGPRVSWEEVHAEASEPRVAHAGSTGPHKAREEAHAEASKLCVARATTQGRAPGVEGEPDRTQGVSRDRWVGRSQRGETHLRKKQCDKRWVCGGWRGQDNDTPCGPGSNQGRCGEWSEGIA